MTSPADNPRLSITFGSTAASPRPTSVELVSATRSRGSFCMEVEGEQER